MLLVRFLQVFALNLILIPNFVRACAVCFSGKEETLEAFYLTTVLLTLLPIFMLACIGIWLFRKYRKL